MCEHCGCDSSAHITATNLQTGKLVVLHQHAHEHVHADGTRHSHHHHAHGSTHHHGHDEPFNVVHLGAQILEKNNALAVSNRAWLDARGIFAVNLMSAPGAGKTTLLERTIGNLKQATPIYVVEGDQATLRDGERVRDAGASVVQLNTGTGCHLDAHMVAHGLEELAPRNGSMLFIENVGNLVCPALFDLGEHRKVAILSVPEGDDKPLKYPHMFRVADLVLINKIDLISHVDFDVDRAVANAREVNPDVRVLTVSARTGQGLDTWSLWLREQSGNDASAQAGWAR
jgi:hydrogenase nickel incorporation protein HypB